MFIGLGLQLFVYRYNLDFFLGLHCARRGRRRRRWLRRRAGGGGGAKTTVAEQIGQAVQSTSNLLHLMEQSSPTQVHLSKLPKNLLAKASLARNTEHVLQQLPNVISSLDAFMDSGLQSASQIKTVTQVLSNMENTQLRAILPASRLQKDEKNNEPGELRVE